MMDDCMTSGHTKPKTELEYPAVGHSSQKRWWGEMKRKMDGFHLALTFLPLLGGSPPPLSLLFLIEEGIAGEMGLSSESSHLVAGAELCSRAKTNFPLVWEITARNRARQSFNNTVLALLNC